MTGQGTGGAGGWLDGPGEDETAAEPARTAGSSTSAAPPPLFPAAPDGVPRSPSGRVPQWVVDDRLGAPSRYDYAWRSDLPPAGSLTPSSPPPRRRRVRPLLALALALTVVLGIAVLADLGPGRDATVAPGTADAAPVTPPPRISIPPGTEPSDAPPQPTPGDGAGPEALPDALPAPDPAAEQPPSPQEWTNPSYPPPGATSSPQPLGMPPPAPEQPGAFAFTALQDDGATPVGYDPCRPLRWVLRPDNAPPEGEALVQEAFAALSAATGLQPAFEGTTDEAPSLDRQPYQPDRYGQQWAPVLVSWVTSDEVSQMEGDVLGLAGSVSAQAADLPAVYVSGTVYLDGPQLAELYAEPDGRTLVRSTIEHELGHLVGLAHVEDPAQLMFPETTGEVTTYQSGDLAGLAALGQGACVPEI